MWWATCGLCPASDLGGAVAAARLHLFETAIFWSACAGLLIYLFVSINKSLNRIRAGPRSHVRARLFSLGTTMITLILLPSGFAALVSRWEYGHMSFAYWQLATDSAVIVGICVRLFAKSETKVPPFGGVSP